MNSSTVKSDRDKIAVELTPNEALALTGVEFNADHDVKASAQRKIRAAFEKTFDFQAQER
ncbi:MULTISPECIES: hypothetical protein [Paenibacillus]|jgi:hypothetical protein|uniref:Uncharacterized protein n=2 Tax=Paenibacillus lactis TaxID=228574 RepID=G4H7U7_9BACL|nr:hypothetical protein [Paenibacillus lactis]EHB67932.1 hypothetical protein PaelaDRAFT_0058 [Paenibacillus lactis 154]MBP1892319.1 hypothetical protein [Paenibacillus lactis]MCM3493064.1 hypothetical protein [Paenibacillus lactis]GIO89768.1 hypothetical protein J31TS3_09950 [Paenibacillus lactis]HAG01262.1 hypothetical protein [Paenibacillus lactis]